MDETLKEFPTDEQLKTELIRLKEEAKETEGEETSWWRDRISDLEVERDAFVRLAEKRAKQEEKRQAELAVVREEAELIVLKLDAFTKRFQNDTTFQESLRSLKEKVLLEPHEPEEWKATLRYVEKDLESHVEEAQQRAIAEKERKEKELKSELTGSCN